MALLLFSLNAHPDTPEGARFAELVAAVGNKFPNEFFLALVAHPPADTSAQPNWDWITLPEGADEATWRELLLLYGRWLKPAATVFWGETVEAWLPPGNSDFGTAVLAGVAEETATVVSANHAIFGANSIVRVLELLERQLPLTLTLRSTLSFDEISRRLAERVRPREVCLHCPGVLGAHERAQLRHIERNYDGRIQLMLSLREGLLMPSARIAALRFLLARRKRYEVKVCSTSGTPASLVVDRLWRVLAGKA